MSDTRILKKMINARILPNVEEKIAMSRKVPIWLGSNRNGSIEYCWIRWRFLRSKFYPWRTIAIALFKILTRSGIDRTHAQNRYLSAIGKIDFVDVLTLLDNLLW